MTEQWNELKETVTELSDNDGTATQQEVCKFLANYMDVLEKQMVDQIDHVLEIIDEAIGRDAEYAKDENDEALKKCIKRSIDMAFDIRDAVESLKGDYKGERRLNKRKTSKLYSIEEGIDDIQKKPVEVEAFPYAGTRKSDTKNFLEEYLFSKCPKWLSDAWNDGVIFMDETKNLYIKTLEGVMRVNIGDYIIRGVQGEIYSCKPDIFEQTYEVVKIDE